MKKTNTRKLAPFLIFLGIVIFLGIGSLFLINTGLYFDLSISPQIFANFGTVSSGVVGVLFSLVSILLLIQNLDNQTDNFKKQQLQNHIFELIKIHRDNVSNLPPNEDFVTLLGEFEECLKNVQNFSNSLGAGNSIDEKEILNLAYLTFFFGVYGKVSQVILNEKLKGKYNQHQLSQLYIHFPQIPIHSNMYMGHQSTLGHYFRHMYLCVTFINSQQEVLSYKEKYKYVKALRAQLSNQEQALLFFNSLSELGAPWESASGNPNFKLITKYNLVKNIPTGYTSPINIRNYYGEVLFEGDQSQSNLLLNRRKLEESYT